MWCGLSELTIVPFERKRGARDVILVPAAENMGLLPFTGERRKRKVDLD